MATPADVTKQLTLASTYLNKTTVGFINPNWKKPPAGTYWQLGLAALTSASSLMDDVDVLPSVRANIKQEIASTVVYLKKTTYGMRNKHWTIPPASSNWHYAFIHLNNSKVQVTKIVGFHAYVDAGVVHGRTVLTASEDFVGDYVDATTLHGRSVVSGAEVYSPGGTSSNYVDSGVIHAVAVVSGVDKYPYKDAATVVGHHTITAVETKVSTGGGGTGGPDANATHVSSLNLDDNQSADDIYVGSSGFVNIVGHDTSLSRFNVGPSNDSCIVVEDTLGPDGGGGKPTDDFNIHDGVVHDSGTPRVHSWGDHGIYETANSVHPIARVEAYNHQYGQAFSPRWPNDHYQCYIHDTPYGIGVFDYSDGSLAAQPLLFRELLAHHVTQWFLYIDTPRLSHYSSGTLGPNTIKIELDHCTIDLRSGSGQQLNMAGDPGGSSITNCIIITDQPGAWYTSPHTVFTARNVVLTTAQFNQYMNPDYTPKNVAGSPIIGAGIATTGRANALYGSLPDVGRFQYSSTVAPPAGSLTPHTTAQMFRDSAHPSTVASLSVDGGQNTAQADYGVLVMGTFGGPTSPPAPSSSAFTIRDIATKRIGTIPAVDDGTAEAGIWIGVQANATRLIGDGSWMGMWTGAQCRDSVIDNFKLYHWGGSDWDAILPLDGLYIEHFTRRTTFSNFDIYAANYGIISEWWYADPMYASYVHSEYPTTPSGKAGSCKNTIQNGRVYCPAGKAGIYLDAGTWGYNINNVTFWGPGDAILAPNNLAGPDPNVIDQASCIFLNGGQHVRMHNNAIG